MRSLNIGRIIQLKRRKGQGQGRKDGFLTLDRYYDVHTLPSFDSLLLYVQHLSVVAKHTYVRTVIWLLHYFFVGSMDLKQ